jgi:hypothetical protein
MILRKKGPSSWDFDATRGSKEGRGEAARAVGRIRFPQFFTVNGLIVTNGTCAILSEPEIIIRRLFVLRDIS